MLNGLKNVKTVLSILFVGVCFSLYHASLLQLIYQFIYGVVLSFLTIKSKSVIPAIIAHLLNNVIVLVLTYFYGMSDVIMTPYLIVIGLLLLVGGVLFLAFYKRENTKKPDDKGETTKAFLFASAGLIVSLLIAIIGVF
jgi:membrane protease YdiL (CAAX protease family)